MEEFYTVSSFSGFLFSFSCSPFTSFSTLYAKAPVHHIHESETESQHEVSHPRHEHHKKEDVEPATPIAESVEKEVKGLQEKEKIGRAHV